MSVRLYPFQREGVELLTTIMGESTGALLADDMGLGKSAQAIRATTKTVTHGSRILVICPASLKMNWEAEINQWTTPDGIAIYSGKSDEKYGRPIGAGWHIINYDVLHTPHAHSWASSVQWDMVIVDEAHCIRNHKAKRTKAVLGLGSKHWLFLTGTPIANRPIEIWPVLQFLLPDDPTIRKRHLFGKRYCGGHKTRWGWNFTGHSNLAELRRKIKPIMVRRKKVDVLDDLPPKIRQIIELPPRSEVATRLNKLTMEWELTTKTVEALRATAKEAKDVSDDAAFKSAASDLGKAKKLLFTQYAAARAELGEAKAPLVAAHVHGLVHNAGAGKVVIAYHHKVTANTITEEIERWHEDTKLFKIDGSTSPDKRKGIVDEFNNYEGKAVMLAQTLACGTGLNMTGASAMVFAELDWVPANVAQMEDRLHRIGQTDSVQIQYLCFASSIDSMVATAVAKKIEVIDRAIDGDQEDKPGGGVKMPTGEKAEEMGKSMPIAMKETAHLGVFELAKAQRWSSVHEQIGNNLASHRSPNTAQYGIMLWLCHHYRKRLPDHIRTALPINKDPQLTLPI